MGSAGARTRRDASTGALLSLVLALVSCTGAEARKLPEHPCCIGGVNISAQWRLFPSTSVAVRSGVAHAWQGPYPRCFFHHIAVRELWSAAGSFRQDWE